MKCHAVLMLAVLTLTSVACDKKTDTAAATGDASLTLTLAVPSGATGKGGKCVDGAYKDPHGIYCVKVPDGYKPPKATRTDAYKKSTDQFETDDGFNFSIEYFKPVGNNGDFDSMKDLYSSETADLKKTSSALFENGNGFYIERHDKKYKQTDTNAVLKSGDLIITCESSTLDDKPLTPADACKTLRGM